MRMHIVAGAALPLLFALVSPAQAQQPKYYFQVRDVRGDVDASLKEFLGDAVRKELDAHPEFTSDLGGARGEQAVVEQLQKRGLKGFDMTLGVEKIKKDVKEPKPGSRFRVVDVSVKLTLFGNTIPGSKMAFRGEGESGLKSEVPEKKVDSEVVSLTRDAANDAVKQAVEQGLARLSVMSTGAPGPKAEKPRKAKGAKNKKK